MILGYRSSDAVITICQNNSAKSIEISNINKPAEDMLGYENGELAKRPLQKILPDRIASLLSEYVEYESDANDVGNVLSKVQSFSIIGRDGKESAYRHKIVRAESTGERVVFNLVLHDKTGLRKNEALRKAIQDNFKGHEVLDPEFGLPDRQSLAKDIELMGYYNSKSDLRTCYAILQLDHYDELNGQYGHATCVAILKHIAHICRQNLRPDDVVGIVSPRRIGVLLLDTMPESARMVFNRLRWQIAANPYALPDRTSIGLSISISFSKVSGGTGDKKLIESCESFLDMQGAGAINVLVEVAETDKRNTADS